MRVGGRLGKEEVEEEGGSGKIFVFFDFLSRLKSLFRNLFASL